MDGTDEQAEDNENSSPLQEQTHDESPPEATTPPQGGIEDVGAAPSTYSNAISPSGMENNTDKHITDNITIANEVESNARNWTVVEVGVSQDSSEEGVCIAVEEDDDEEEEGPAFYANINPLSHVPEGMEMETIRNSYKSTESGDNVDSNSNSNSEDNDVSPNNTKRTTMFQSGSLPDDFLLSATLAIRTSILASDSKRRFLDDADFKTTKKYKISMAGDKKSQIKDYAPLVFSHIRKKYGIAMQSYLMSWSDDKLTKQKTTGKSDACFVHSPDCKFILKTIPKSEAKRLRKLLMSYHQHLEAYPDTLLSKIFGLHRVDTWRRPRIYFAIFNNVFDTHNAFKEIYDLKGSSLGRRASVGDFVLKDLDLENKRRIHLPSLIKKRILDQITIDCKFLCGNRLMDYSLLVGIRQTEESPQPTAPKPPTDQKLPGLLFFLESSKSIDASPKVRILRRKSMTVGKPMFASMDDMRDDLAGLEVGKNTALNAKITDTPPDSTATDSTDTTATTANTTANTTAAATDASGKPAPSITIIDSDSSDSPSPEGLSVKIPLPTIASVPILKGALKSSSSANPSTKNTTSGGTFHMMASSSAPLLNMQTDPNGFFDIGRGHVPFYQQDEGGLRSPRLQDENTCSKYFEIYHFGIIDFLQRYNKKKKIANFAKSLKHDKGALSTVEPTFYMNRFLKMAEKVVGGE